MKIKKRLTFQYSAVTACVFLASMLAIYLWSEHSRSSSFYRSLQKEAVTKANLFLSGRVDAETMHSVYSNNKDFIDEVEVAIYRQPFKMIYHDAVQNDIVKETATMISEIIEKGSICFTIGKYQAVGMIYRYDHQDFIVTAAAFDGYGYSNLQSLRNILILVSLLGLSILALIGYILAQSSLSPIQEIIRKMKEISASNIEKRLPVSRNEDELDELSRSFNLLLEDLEKAFQAQKLFVSNVSHELRTPMAALIAETEITLLKPRTGDRYENSLKNVLDDARKIIRLIDGLLNLAKADYNASQIKMEEVRIDELLMDARKTVMTAHPDYKIDLVFEEESDNDTLITVYGNLYLLTTAFVNLIENNCKFSENRTSIVQIGFSGDNTIIRCSDNGIGIPESSRGQLCTPFYRGENVSGTSGHGIGMALASKIILLHKGRLSVKSKENEGTTFIVEIPHL